MRRIELTLFLSFLVCCVSSLQAQPGGTVGRLPNGQAYRTDGAGNQIVDYIAELEVTNEAHERRIRGLLAEIEDLRAAKNTTAPVKERELLFGEPLPNRPTKVTAVVPEIEPTPSLPVKKNAPQVTCGEQECDIFIQEVSGRRARECSKKVQDLQEKRKECETRFLEIQTAMNRGESGTALLRNQVQRAELKIQSLEDLLQQREKQIETLKIEEAKGDAELQKVQGRLAAVRSEKEKLARKKPAPTPSVSDDVRGKVKNRYLALIKLRNKRDSLFASYNKSNPSLSISKRPVRSKKGKRLEQLLGMAKTTQNSRQLHLLIQESHRLEQVIKSDIALVKRIQKK
jgi:DNA repair exonuclease SbcCD ATPase subunit